MGEKILAGFLIAVASVGAIFFLALGTVAFFNGRGETAEHPPTPSHAIRGTLPSTPPTETPTKETAEPTEGPENQPQQEESPTDAPTENPAANPPATQTQAPTHAQPPVPATTINPTSPPAQQTQTPVRPAGGTVSNGDGTYTHDFTGGRVLATAESNNNNDPVYHTKDCTSARKIPPENEIWYASEQAAKDAGRRLCGNCGR